MACLMWLLLAEDVISQSRGTELMGEPIALLVKQETDALGLRD